MAYNKAGAEKAWLQWKEADEQRMRQAGVDDDIIQQSTAAIGNSSSRIADIMSGYKIAIHILISRQQTNLIGSSGL